VNGRLAAALLAAILLLGACTPTEGGGAGGSSAPQSVAPASQPGATDQPTSAPRGPYDY
jgi:hypothetical protein